MGQLDTANAMVLSICARCDVLGARDVLHFIASNVLLLALPNLRSKDVHAQIRGCVRTKRLKVLYAQKQSVHLQKWGVSLPGALKKYDKGNSR